MRGTQFPLCCSTPLRLPPAPLERTDSAGSVRRRLELSPAPPEFLPPIRSRARRGGSFPPAAARPAHLRLLLGELPGPEYAADRARSGPLLKPSATARTRPAAAPA